MTHVPAVGSGRGFGANALQVDGRIFAMVTDGHLVLKLPNGRVAEFIADGRGAPFDAGKGRPMKEWVGLSPGDETECAAYMREARQFVAR